MALILFPVQNVAKRLDISRINAMQPVHIFKPDSSGSSPAMTFAILYFDFGVLDAVQDLALDAGPGSGCSPLAPAGAAQVLVQLETRRGDLGLDTAPVVPHASPPR